MTVFYLYRLKIERLKTLSLFDDPSRSRGDIILAAIERKPSEELRKGQFWRIGNIQKLSDDTVFFALGKITKATHEFYDEALGHLEKPMFGRHENQWSVAGGPSRGQWKKFCWRSGSSAPIKADPQPVFVMKALLAAQAT